MADLARRIEVIASALIAGDRPIRLEAINRMARHAIAFPTLDCGAKRRLVAVLEWQPAPPAAHLARLAIEELGCLDPARLRICARRECPLLFYDTTRSKSQRWHRKFRAAGVSANDDADPTPKVFEQVRSFAAR